MVLRRHGGAGPTIVLLPGSVGTCEVFFKQIAALGDDHRVVAATYPALSDAAAWPMASPDFSQRFNSTAR